MKDNHLEIELTHTSEGQQSTSIIWGKLSKSMHESLAIKEVQGTFRVADEARLQGYNFGFMVCELIMQDRFPEIGYATDMLIPCNAMPEEIVDAMSHRRERLRKALQLIDFVLPHLFPRNE